MEGVVDTQRLKDVPAKMRNSEDWGTASFDTDGQLVLHIPHAGKTIVIIPTRRTVLGRQDRNAGIYPDLDLSPYDALVQGVSRQHAAIRRESGQTLTVVDLSSSNHTYLNGEQLTPHHPTLLRDGDKLRLGRLVLEVYFR
jgi:pSer/pThr/pTyr-binding forkhead associated (FHA) protein